MMTALFHPYERFSAAGLAEISGALHVNQDFIMRSLHYRSNRMFKTEPNNSSSTTGNANKAATAAASPATATTATAGEKKSECRNATSSSPPMTLASPAKFRKQRARNTKRLSHNGAAPGANSPQTQTPRQPWQRLASNQPSLHAPQ